MPQVADWYSVTLISLQGLWQGMINFLPRFIGALVIFLVGWIFATVLGSLIAQLLKRLQFNKVFERGGWKEALEKAELKVDAAEFIGGVFKWVFAIVFLSAAVEILGFVQFTQLLQSILAYLPNVVVAVLLFAVTVVIADIVEKLVKAAVGGVQIGYAKLAGAIVRWAIWVFALLAILRQLLVIPELVDILFRGLVYGIAGVFVLAFGLAFGLGGKDVAAEFLRDLKRKMGGE